MTRSCRGLLGGQWLPAGLPKLRPVLAAAIAVGLAAVWTAPKASAAVATSVIRTGLTATRGHATPSQRVDTVPYFADSFSYGANSYPYYMVGTNPRAGAATTVVSTVIVPLRLAFADGHVSDPGGAVSATLQSPLFRPASFISGDTQYGDAVRRAMFWRYVAGSGYHVLLARPIVLPTLTLHVPAADGVFVPAGDPSGPPSLGFHVAVDTGVVSASWFYSVFDSLLPKVAGPRVLPIVLSRNVALSTDPIPYGAPTIGFHEATASTSSSGAERIQTAIWASYADPSTIIELPSILRNTDVLSHEVSEWMHDPFLANQVPSWESPLPLSAAVYGCSSLLETGDAISDVSFNVNGYQLQDEAFLSWFAHQTPSIGINGQYSFLGTFTAPSPLC